MLNDIIRTGSISQDALRLGFQATCNKGIANLLKVDDITVEECSKFKEKHMEEVKDYLEGVEEGAKAKFVRLFKKEMTNLYHAPTFWLWRLFYTKKVKKQEVRIFDVKIVGVEKAKLNITEGMWTTVAELEITKEAWAGVLEGEAVELEKEVYNDSVRINTRAKKCVVDYTSYDNYHHRYIPDEAAQAANEALAIGMDRIKVASPLIVRSIEPQPDPIIVGHVEDQMFIIAWFGYDKDNHMSCNT